MTTLIRKGLSVLLTAVLATLVAHGLMTPDMVVVILTDPGVMAALGAISIAANGVIDAGLKRLVARFAPAS